MTAFSKTKVKFESSQCSTIPFHFHFISLKWIATLCWASSTTTRLIPLHGRKNNYKYRTTNNNKLSGCSRIRKAFLRKAHNSFNKLRSSAENIKINFSSIFSLAKFGTFMLKNCKSFSQGSRYVLHSNRKCFPLSTHCRLQNLKIRLSWFGREVSDNDLWKVKVEITCL